MELYPAGPPIIAAVPHSRPLELWAETDPQANDDAGHAYDPGVHREGPDGWCEGCLREGRLTFYPCYPAMWGPAAGDHRATGGR